MSTVSEESRGTVTPVLKSAQSQGDEMAAERLETATELLSGWVWETDAEHRFTYLSEGIETYTKRAPDWHYGKTRQEIGNVVDQDQQELFFRKLEAREPFSAVEFTRRVDNEIIHLRSAGKPFFRGGEFRGYRGIAFRISNEVQERRRRRAAEREQSKTLAALNEVVSLFPNAIVVYDADRRVAFANRQYFALLGMRESELAAHPSLDSLVETLAVRGELVGGSVEEIVDRHVQLAKANQPFAFQRGRPDGSVLQVQGFPLPCGGHVRVFTDVTLQTEDKWTIGALKERIKQLSTVS